MTLTFHEPPNSVRRTDIAVIGPGRSRTRGNPGRKGRREGRGFTLGSERANFVLPGAYTPLHAGRPLAHPFARSKKSDEASVDEGEERGRLRRQRERR